MSAARAIQRIAIVGTGVIGASWAAYYLARGSRKKSRPDVVELPVPALDQECDCMCISTTRSFLTMEGKLASAICGCQSDVGNWLLAVGPTFIFPTATESKLGQNDWQGGPTAALGYAGQHFLTYVFPQQWFKMGGDGQTSEQMDAQHAFVYFLQNGWTVGTNPDVFVDWKAKPGNQVTFPVGLQVEKLRKVGSLPVKFDVRAEYYAVRPEVYGPKWGAQLRITPVLPSLVRRPIL